jgi:hypothetical protein
LVSVIIAPIIVQYTELGVAGWLAVLILVAFLIWAIRQSKKPVEGGIVSEAPAPGD